MSLNHGEINVWSLYYHPKLSGVPFKRSKVCEDAQSFPVGYEELVQISGHTICPDPRYRGLIIIAPHNGHGQLLIQISPDSQYVMTKDLTNLVLMLGKLILT